MNDKTKEFRQAIADSFVKVLEEKKLTWKKEWKGLSSNPINASTDKEYKGINNFYLSIIALIKNYDDPRWATFKQIKEKGWHLKKGSKGTQVEYWMPFNKEVKKVVSWSDYEIDKKILSYIELNEKYSLISKYFTVFNATNIEGIPELQLPELNEINQSELIEKISTSMNVQIKHTNGDKAFYRPIDDLIQLPLPGYFENDYVYNATALHELAHATGAAHRLNRNIKNTFGSSDYAYEELIAEISSAFMGTNLQLDSGDYHIDNHKAYVQSWIKAIQDKPEVLIKAVKEAEKVADYLEYHAGLINEKEYNHLFGSSFEVPKSNIHSITQVTVSGKQMHL